MGGVRERLLYDQDRAEDGIVGVAGNNGSMEYLPLEEVAHCFREMPGKMVVFKAVRFQLGEGVRRA